MFVKKIPFLHTILEMVCLRTSEYLDTQTKESLASTLRQVLRLYLESSFIVKYIDANLQFEGVEDIMPEVTFDLVDADNHVNQVEQSIWTKKEGIRCLLHQTPFKRISRLMIQRLVKCTTRSLNSFLADNSISNSFSPLAIVTGISIINANAYCLNFGLYMQVLRITDYIKVCLGYIQL